MGICVGTTAKKPTSTKLNSQIDKTAKDIDSKINSIQGQVSGKLDSSIRNNKPALSDLSLGLK